MIIVILMAVAFLAFGPLASASEAIEQELPSFSAKFPIYSDREARTAKGDVSGFEYAMSHQEIHNTEPFEMTLRPPSLPEQQAHLAFFLLLDIVCLKNEMGTAPIEWPGVAARDKDAWTVKVACNGKKRSF